MNGVARVSLDGSPAGLLIEAGSWRDSPPHLSFAYDAAWLGGEEPVPLSAVVPLCRGWQRSAAVDAFFENLMPEGCLREAAAAARRFPPGDLFRMLTEFGGNCVGAVEVMPCGPPQPASSAASVPEARKSSGHDRTSGERQAGRALLPDVHVPLRMSDVRSLSVASLEHSALPGIHRKVPLELSSERRSARATPGPGHYILKPQSAAPFLPENEFVTLRVAAAAGVEVVPVGLATLADGSRALLTRRFDRTNEGRKIGVDDFCQLTARRPSEKYDGTAEMCADIVRRHASEPLVEVARLFRRFVVAWWTNAHLHLKNLALLTGGDGVARLCPAHGLRCVGLEDDEAALALPVNGKRDSLGRADWLRFADSCSLRRPAAERVLREVMASLDAALAVVEESPLPDSSKRTYAETLRARAQVLG